MADTNLTFHEALALLSSRENALAMTFQKRVLVNITIVGTPGEFSIMLEPIEGQGTPTDFQCVETAFGKEVTHSIHTRDDDYYFTQLGIAPDDPLWQVEYDVN